MPRQPRLDAPGTLHHVMGRGIETSKIFRTKKDREDCLGRLAVPRVHFFGSLGRRLPVGWQAAHTKESPSC